MSSGTPGAAWKDESVVTGFIDERRKLIPLFDVQEELAKRLITRGGRTHLVSPQMAAAAAIEGHFVDIREWD